MRGVASMRCVATVSAESGLRHDNTATTKEGEKTMTKNITDISLEAVQLAISLRQIAREHPEAKWTEPMSSDWSRTWTVSALATHLTAIHTVLGIIAETPNGYINNEALEGLRRQFRPAVEFLETPWAAERLREINSRLP